MEITHDELLWAINSVVESGPCETVGHYSSAKALRAVVKLINNLQDTESWQDDVDYKNGYNNAMNDIRLIIEKELK